MFCFHAQLVDLLARLVAQPQSKMTAQNVSICLNQNLIRRDTASNGPDNVYQMAMEKFFSGIIQDRDIILVRPLCPRNLLGLRTGNTRSGVLSLSASLCAYMRTCVHARAGSSQASRSRCGAGPKARSVDGGQG